MSHPVGLFSPSLYSLCPEAVTIEYLSLATTFMFSAPLLLPFGKSLGMLRCVVPIWLVAVLAVNLTTPWKRVLVLLRHTMSNVFIHPEHIAPSTKLSGKFSRFASGRIIAQRTFLEQALLSTVMQRRAASGGPVCLYVCRHSSCCCPICSMHSELTCLSP